MVTQFYLMEKQRTHNSMMICGCQKEEPLLMVNGNVSQLKNVCVGIVEPLQTDNLLQEQHCASCGGNFQ